MSFWNKWFGGKKERGIGQGAGRGMGQGMGQRPVQGPGQGPGQGPDQGMGQGSGRQPEGMAQGPGGFCVCPNCGTKVPHQTGAPCYEMKCPNCGQTMTRPQD